MSTNKMNEPDLPPKKKSNVILFIALGSVGLVFISCCGACLISRPLLQSASDALNKPLDVVFQDGKFDIEEKLISHRRPGHNMDMNRRFFKIQAKPDTAYWAKVTAATPLRLDAEREFGAEMIQPQNRGNTDALYYFEKADTVLVVVEGTRNDFSAEFSIQIYEVDGNTPLPPRMRLDATTPPPTPKMQTTATLSTRNLSSGAFARDGKTFWGAGQDGTLMRWSVPDGVMMGRFAAKRNFYEIGLDARKNLYLQTGPFHIEEYPRGAISDDFVGDPSLFLPKKPKAPPTDIEVYAALSPQGDSEILPAPLKIIPLAGVVARFINSPDNRWIYFLDSHNKKMCRLDADKLAIDKELPLAMPDVRAFCLTPNGKTLYCCGESSAIDIINAETFQFDRTVPLKAGKSFAIAASDDGIVAMAGSFSRADDHHYDLCLVDLRVKTAAARNPLLFNLDVRHLEHVHFSSDQRTVILSGPGGCYAVGLADQLGLFNVSRSYHKVGKGMFHGRSWLNPDRRHAVHDVGAMLSVGP